MGGGRVLTRRYDDDMIIITAAVDILLSAATMRSVPIQYILFIICERV